MAAEREAEEQLAAEAEQAKQSEQDKSMVSKAADGEESGEEDDDEVEYEIYYEKNEIKQVLRNQKKDLFDDIVVTKIQAAEELEREEGGAVQLNKFLIEDWAPKEQLDEPSKKKQRKKGPTEEEQDALQEHLRKHREEQEARKARE